MNATLSRVLTVLATACLACGGDEPVDPNGLSIDGLALEASVTNIAGGGTTIPPGSILALQVSLRNTTNTAIQVHHPAGCAVRARLYLPGNNNLLYDQTLFPCEDEVTVALVIPAGETKTLTSGTTFPYAIQADSVPGGFYRAVAVLRITGEDPIELEAGQYRLPNCPTPSTCVYVGPPATIDTTRQK